jgi:3-deoxy-7-phosphoheptulonate synthase
MREIDGDISGAAGTHLGSLAMQLTIDSTPPAAHDRPTHVSSPQPLSTPEQLRIELPRSARATRTVEEGRAQLTRILHGQDDRLLVVVGPCSIHDPAAALVYAARLAELAEQHRGELLVCMRAYFEKARTDVGWKGLLNDPHLDGSCDVALGLRLARRLLLSLAELGLPSATEALDPAVPPYLADLLAWTAIGARTTESQTHRELASGLPMPVGFKNGTDGGLEIAVHALKAAQSPHSFLAIDERGQVAVQRTQGNPHGHVVLRGGRSGPNFAEAHVLAAAKKLATLGLPARVMIDCSHGNSQKNHDNQPRVARAVAEQVARGNSPIFGVMLESQLVAGCQALGSGRSLVFGQSVTDACIDMETTELVLSNLAEAVRQRRSAPSTSHPA